MEEERKERHSDRFITVGEPYDEGMPAIEQRTP
jgi:hypothetical protein